LPAKFSGQGTGETVAQAASRIPDEHKSFARKLLEENRDKVEAMAAALMEYETIDADQINDIMAGLPVREPKPRQTPVKPTSTGSGTGTTSAKPQPATKS
jgi:cell division protease FtsH